MNTLLILGIVLFVYMNGWFALSLVRKRNDLADVAWGLGFIVLSWVSYYLSASQSTRGLLVTLLVTVWGVRLAIHIHARNRGQTEDHRYAQWREEWGRWFYLRSYLQVYLLQGTLLFLVALPIFLVHAGVYTPLGLLDYLGVLVWLLGFFFEVVGDAQLSRFVRDPENRGHVIQEGLWRYTRHPNYFGEVTLWWGVWLIALSGKAGVLSIVGPLTITILILKVSGIPMLERKMRENPEFVEYAKKTNAFFPWFPKE